MKQKKLLVAMSGGVDSSVSALLLKQKGYDVVGVFMKNYSKIKTPFMPGVRCWLKERKFAKKIAKQLKIPLLTIDSESEYTKKVIKPMYQAYEKGLTPNPDILCNKLMKFPDLIEKAKKIKADYIATGHYAKTKDGKLYIPKDKGKDQTYFLYTLKESQLKKTLFPLENLTKQEVRQIAKQNNFPNYNKPGTRGICFIGKVNMKKFLQRKIKKKEGKVISPDGKIIGTHPGTMFFTIGERIGPRHGIKINSKYYNKTKSRLYIAKKLKNNILVIAPKNHKSLKIKIIKIKKFSKINPKQPTPKTNLKARIRHLGTLHKGKLTKKSNKYQFTLTKPIEGVAPGQAIVIYYKNQVIGGGEIA